MEEQIDNNFTEIGKLYYQKELCKIAMANLINEQIKLINEVNNPKESIIKTV